MSNALRTALDYAAQDQQQEAQLREQAAAQDLWAPTRAYEAGRTNNDVNANLADEASLRNAGRMQEADALAQQTALLRQRQAPYAPEIEKVEDIGSKRGYLRDGASWFGTQLGGMVASAQDPLALTAAGTAVGRAVGAVPRLGAVGKAIQYGAQAGAFGLNQRQMTGEMYGRLQDDPQAFANMTPQEVYRTSNLYGLGAGAAESLLPGVAGHALGGGALKAGAKAITGRSAGATLLGDAALEGATELGQQWGQQQVHSAYNPARDTSGDASELLNAAAGGAAGSAGLGAPHAIANAAYGRAARTGELVKEKAGEMVDITKDAAETAGQAYEDSGLKGVVDLGTEKARGAAGGIADTFERATDYLRDEHGKINYPEATKRAMVDYDRYNMAREEEELLNALPPKGLDEAGVRAWAEEHGPKRANYVAQRLADLEADGVPEATPWLDAITGEDPVVREQALGEASSFLLERNVAANVDRRAALTREFIGGKIQGAAHAVTRAAQKAAGAAVFTGMNVAEGVNQAMGGAKRNAQGTQGQDAPLSYDQWMQARASAGRAFDAHGAKLRAEQRAPAPAPERAVVATTAGELFARAAAREEFGGDVGAREDMGRALAYELSDMADEYELRGFVSPAKFDALADEIRDSVPGAQDIVTRAAVMYGGEAGSAGQKLFADMAQKVADTTLRLRKPTQLQDQLLAVLPQAQQAELRKGGLHAMQEAVTDIARGIMPERRIKDIEKAIGADALRQMLAIIDGPDEAYSARAQNEAMIFGDVPGEFEQQQGARRVAAEAGAPSYSFARSGLQSARTPTRTSPDPFAPDADGKRPHLFNTTLADDTAVGAPALEKKIADVNTLHDGAAGAMNARARALADVFKDLNYSQQQQLALFRDYMAQEGQEARAATIQQMLDGKLDDAVTQKRVLNAMARFTKERSVVVTEQGTQRIPTEMAHGFITSAGKGGDKAMSAIRAGAMKAGKRGTPAYTEAVNREVAKANLLVFQSAEGKNIMGRTGGDKDIYISADRLVKWVRSRPGYDSDTGLPAHQRYLNDLLDGIQSVMGSGYATSELPTMTGADGTKHSFADGLPPGLRLGLRKVSSLQADPITVGELEQERARRLEAYIPPEHLEAYDKHGEPVVGGNMTRGVRYQEMVAEDQDRDYYDPKDEINPVEATDRDDKTPLDVTQDKRYGNAKTEREDLADRTTRKATDIEDVRGLVGTVVKRQQNHVIAQKSQERAGAKQVSTPQPAQEKPSAARQAALARRVVEMVSKEDYGALDTDAKADAFIAATRGVLEHLDRKERADDLTAPEVTARQRLKEMLGPKSAFDWASLYPSWEGDSAPFDARVSQALGREAAPEVAAAGAPKSQSAPVGAQRPESATAKAAAFRRERQELLSGRSADSRVGTMAERIANMTSDPHARSALEVLRAATHAIGITRVNGGSFEQALNDPTVQRAYAELGALRLQGSRTAAAAMRSIQYVAEQHYALPVPEHAERASKDAVAKSGATLQQALEPVLQAKDVPAFAKILAKAVAKVAGQSPIRHDSSMALTEHGEYSVPRGDIRINPVIGSVATVIHEGAHAATVSAMKKDAELHRAVYDLMDHVLVQEPGLAQAYGMTNSLEFLAEGLSNQSFQERLKQIEASEGVRKYLGETIGSAWDAFVGLMRKALGLAPGHDSALSQFLELSGRAMVGTMRAGVSGGENLNEFANRPVVPRADFARRVEGLIAAPEIQRAMSPAAQDRLRLGLLEYSGTQGASFAAALGVEAVRRHLPAMGEDISVESIVDMVRGAGGGQGALSLPSRADRKLNAQGAGKYEGWKTGPTAREGSGIAPDADIKAAKDYLDKVLGPQIKAEFEATTGYSGEWVENDNVIKVSTLTNAGVLNVARHEALHAFFSKFIKANPKAVSVLTSLTDDPRVLRRLEALLKDEPAALAQLADGEERLAYIYQFAMAGMLKLPHSPGKTLMGKVRKFLRQVFQMVSDQERAVDLLYSFERGDFRSLQPSAVGRVVAKSIDQGTWLRQGTRQIDAVAQRVAAAVLPANTILAESVSPTARALARQFFTNPGEEAAGQGEPGYLNARNQQMRRYDNLFRKAVDGLDGGQLNELTEAMQNETPTADVRDPDVAAAKEQLHALFERFHRYLADEKGLRIGKINEAYFPVVYDVDAVRDGKFEELLTGKYRADLQAMADTVNAKRAKQGEAAAPVDVEQLASAIVDHITRANPLDDADLQQRQDGVLRPWFASGEKRVLNFLSPEDRAPFLEKDIVKTLSRYVRQGVRTAEYASRFGRSGALLDRQLGEVRVELEAASKAMLASGDLKNEKAREKWAMRQYRDVVNAVGGMEGTLGSDVSETVRKINNWSVVYQNVRLLPLALFSSFVDPLGIVARGGEVREAFTTFMDGMKGVARQWGDMLREEPAQRRKDRWEELAEHAGVIDAATFSHLLADEYGSVYLDGTARKINEVMFKANGMEAWNRAMRVGATRSAVKFIERHSKNPEAHSQRWMTELGFGDKTQPAFDADGNLITDKRVLMAQHPDMTLEQAEAQIARTHNALVRWVEGAILSPNAAQRPAWGSDPHYSMFWHLKQFAYSFHETIMKRALNEAWHGNVMPLGVFAWYIPTMIAADVTKGLMLGAGELPNYMKGYDLGDWVLHGVDRAGVLGIGQVAIDTAQEPLGLAGPMVEQISEIFTDPVEQNIMHALPANSLYSRALT